MAVICKETAVLALHIIEKCPLGGCDPMLCICEHIIIIS